MRKIYNILFIVLITCPLIMTLTGTGFDPTKENKDIKKFEEISTDNPKKILNEFTTYFNDHFAFKNSFLDVKSDFINKVFNGPFSTESAAIGEDNFLFYSKSGFIPHYTKRTNNDSLTLKWLSVKRKQHYNFCKKQNIIYLSTIFPDKHSIYPEKLPFFFKSAIKSEMSLEEKFNYKMKDNLWNLDLFEILKKKKDLELIYRKMDTHWNDLGAYFGYEAIMNRLYLITRDSSCLPLKLTDYEKFTTTHTQRDLVKHIHPSQFFLENDSVLRIRKQRNTAEPYNCLICKNKISYASKNPQAKSKLKLLFIGDSYGISCRKFFEDHFSEFIHFRYSPYELNLAFDTVQIKQFNPDIIIHGHVQRYTTIYEKKSN